MSTCPAPALSVDCVVFALGSEGLKLLCLERREEPYFGLHALPGGSLRLEETMQQACERLLLQKTGLVAPRMLQVGAFDALGRDPRGRVISFCHLGLAHRSPTVGQTPAEPASAWLALGEQGRMAFDHAQMLQAALSLLRARIRYQPLAFELLGPKFSLSQLQGVYEVVLGRTLDKRNFRKRAMATGCLRPLNEREKGVAHRAARLYRFDSRKHARRSGAFSLI